MMISVRQLSFVTISLFTLSALSYSPNIFAEPTPIGQMIWVKGAIKAQVPGGAPRNLQRRSAIFEHDVIDTDPNSTGEMAFTDTSVVTLSQGSQFKIDQYHYQPGGSPKDKSVMSIIKGGLRTITGVIPKENPESYQMKTPVATIGVRGTQYSAFVSNQGLALKIDSGTIEATNAAGKVELTKCSDPIRCKLYAVVSDEQHAPQAVAKMPLVFAHEPAISPAPALGPPIMPNGTMGPAPAPATTPRSGPPRTVSGFCVGLLKDLYQNTLGRFLD